MAGEGKILYTDLFDAKWKQQAINDFAELEKSATAELKKIATAAKGIKIGLPDQVSNGLDMAKLNKAIKDYNDLQAKNITLQNQLNTAKSKQKELTAEEIRATEATKAGQKALRDRITTEQKLAAVHKDSLAALKIHTAALVKERDTIDPLSKRYSTLTKEIATNEKTLKKHDEAIGRHQRNVGNYKSALDGLPGPLGRAASSASMFGKQLLALASNPIVVFIVALAASLKLLWDAFKSTDEGADLVIQTTSALGAAWKVVTDRIGQVLTGHMKLKDFLPGMQQEILSTAAAAYQYAKAIDAINERTVLWTSQEADLKREESELTRVYKDATLPITDRIAAYERTLVIEKDLLDFRKESAAEMYRAKLAEVTQSQQATNFTIGQIESFIKMNTYAAEQVKNTDPMWAAFWNTNEKGIGELENAYAVLTNTETEYFDTTAKKFGKLQLFKKQLSDQEVADIKTAEAEKQKAIKFTEDNLKAFEAEMIRQDALFGTSETVEQYEKRIADALKLATDNLKKFNDEMAASDEALGTSQSLGEFEALWAETAAFAENAYNNTREGAKKNLDQQTKDLEEWHLLNLDKEAEYQAAKKELEDQSMQPKAWQKKLSETVGYFSDFAGQAIGVWESLAQKQMELAQSQVDIEQQKVDDIEQELSRQTALEAQGVANNADLLKEQLVEQKSIRDIATKELQKSQKQQQRIEDAKQISAIITAIANIIMGWSAVPFGVGQVLGMLGAASMLVGWLALRGQAKATVPAMAEGTEFVDSKEAPQGRDTIDAKLDRGERIVPKEENAKLKGIKNKDLAKYSRLGQAVMEGNIGLYALNFATSRPTDSKIDFSELSHWQREGVSQQKETNSLLKKWKFVSGDGHKVVDMNGNIVNYT